MGVSGEDPGVRAEHSRHQVGWAILPVPKPRQSHPLVSAIVRISIGVTLALRPALGANTLEHVDLHQLTGFCGFHQLKLEGLSRVNLIVGKNNSGKTSLREGMCQKMDQKEGADGFRQRDGFAGGQWFRPMKAIHSSVSGFW